jgi:hypothetical protein
MKTLKLMLGLTCLGMMTLQACKKENLKADVTTSESSSSETSRMWTATKQLYAVGHDALNKAYLYKLTAPAPTPTTGLIPSSPTGFFIGGTHVTHVTGVAITNSAIAISTGFSSNFSYRLITYPFPGPLTTPSSNVPCQRVSDIEFNEYDGKLYGIAGNVHIVKIDPSGSYSINLSPSIPSGSKVAGLCNYNGLLSYSVNDNTAAADNFYSYNPASPALTLPLFSTDWGTGDGGMQYCNGFGWEIFSNTDLRKQITGAYTVTGFYSTAGSPYRITDLTSN